MNALLLDTCATIWLAEGETLSKDASSALSEAAETGTPVLISPMSGWEIGLLAARGRVSMSVNPMAWFERLLAIPGMRLSDLSVRILIASSYLPGSPPRDPVDRILISTAREHGYCLVTRDKNLLAYAKQGHMIALAC